MHVRAKDVVLVLSGKSRGRRGQVLSVDLEKKRAVVEGVNLVKKHQRANPQKGVQGGIVEREAPVAVSVLMLVCPKCSEPTRARRPAKGKGPGVRTCRRCSTSMDK